MRYVVVVSPPDPAIGASAVVGLAAFAAYKLGFFGIVADAFAWFLHIAYLLAVLAGALFGAWVFAMLLVRFRVARAQLRMVVGLLVAVGSWTAYATDDLTGGRVLASIGFLYSAMNVPQADAPARPARPQRPQDRGATEVVLRPGGQRLVPGKCGAPQQPCAAPPPRMMSPP